MGSNTSKSKIKTKTRRPGSKPQHPQHHQNAANCKQCISGQLFHHCCYDTCLNAIFNAFEFVDLVETEWRFLKQHEIQLYNVLAVQHVPAVQLQEIVPLIASYLMQQKQQRPSATATASPKNKNQSLKPVLPPRPRSHSMPSKIQVVSGSPTPSMIRHGPSAPSDLNVHAYFHGYVSVYNRNFPPCFVWLKTALPFDEYDDRPLGKKKKLKITLVGDAGVGKTTLCHRFLNDEFNENYTPTIADCYANTMLLYDAQYSSNSGKAAVGQPRKSRSPTAAPRRPSHHEQLTSGVHMEFDFDCSKIEQEILDTAGGDALSMADAMEETIENGHVFLLCFDVSRSLTFRYLKQYILPRIQQHFENKAKMNKSSTYTMDQSSHVGPCALILVGLKVDKREQRDSAMSVEFDVEIRNAMAEEMAKTHTSAMRFARQLQIPYIETSSKTGQNVHFLFKQCLYEYWVQTQSNCINWRE